MGERYPNTSSPTSDPSIVVLACEDGCLFNVSSDPEERTNLATTMADTVTQMRKRLASLEEGFFNNNDTGVDACPAEECAPAPDVLPRTMCTRVLVYNV